MAVEAPFPIDDVLVGVTLAYKNAEMVADMVLPRVQVGKKEFKYNVYTKDEPFTVPQTLVGRKGRPNEVEFTMSESASYTYDYGLDDVIPNDDIANAQGRFDPRGRAVEGLTDLILLDREVRVASTVFNASNHANNTTLSGTTQWSDFTNSNPIDAVMASLDIPMMRPNVLVMGQAVWTKFRQHPKVVSAILGNNGTSGVVDRRAVAALLEIEEIIVGQGWYNTAKKGQTASYSRIWGKHCAAIYRNKNADNQRGITWGFTAQFQDRIAGSIPEPKVGLRGGERIRVGESVRELVIANDVSYFWQNAVA